MDRLDFVKVKYFHSLQGLVKRRKRQARLGAITTEPTHNRTYIQQNVHTVRTLVQNIYMSSKLNSKKANDLISFSFFFSGQRPEQTVYKEDLRMANRHMKRCSESLVMREMQTKTIVRVQLLKLLGNTVQTRDLQQLELPFPAGGDASAQPPWKAEWPLLTKFGTHICRYHPNKRKTYVQRKICV